MKRYGPHIAARKTHQRLWKFSFVTKKSDFCNNIGGWRKADIRQKVARHQPCWSRHGVTARQGFKRCGRGSCRLRSRIYVLSPVSHLVLAVAAYPSRCLARGLATPAMIGHLLFSVVITATF
jgi:hypothetical protein